MAAIIDRCRNHRTLRDDHAGLQTIERNNVAAANDGASGARDRLVVLQPHSIFGLDLIAVIIKPAERNQFRQRFQTAFVICVPVADHHIVDVREAGTLGRGEDALRVPVAIARIAGVEQQRLAIGSDEQSRCAAFDIDPVDFEIAGGP